MPSSGKAALKPSLLSLILKWVGYKSKSGKIKYKIQKEWQKQVHEPRDDLCPRSFRGWPARHSEDWLRLCICSGLWNEKHTLSVSNAAYIFSKCNFGTTERKLSFNQLKNKPAIKTAKNSRVWERLPGKVTSWAQPPPGPAADAVHTTGCPAQPRAADGASCGVRWTESSVRAALCLLVAVWWLWDIRWPSAVPVGPSKKYII